MSQRTWRRKAGAGGVVALALWLTGTEAFGQDSSSPLSPRGDLPFGRLPAQMPGPPRAEGELPEGLRQPPSDLPGRAYGPPQAQGYSPFAPPRMPESPLIAPGSMLGPLPGFVPLPPIGPPSLVLPPALPGIGTEAFQPPLLGTTPLGRDERPPEEAAAPPLPLPPSRLSIAEIRERVAPTLPRPPRLLREEDQPNPLRLEEVLISVETTYPPFLTFIQERALARGNLVSAQGSFDLNLSLDARNWALGYYKRYLYDVFFEQQTMVWGTKVFAGWRLGAGDWPGYYQYLQTKQGGAYVHGLEVPLLRGGRIDARRAKLWQSQIEQRKVEPTISRQRIDLFRNAARAYWNWVAAGQGYLVYEALLELALIRTRFLERQVELGLVPRIELIDNERVVNARQTSLVAARRRFQQTAIDLSLFYRDPNGLPALPDPERLPLRFPPTPPPEQEKFPEDLEVALRLRPELRALRLEFQKVGIDYDLAQNDTLPSMMLYVYGEQNVGQNVPLQNKQPYILESSILFDVPIQRRMARGRVVAIGAELRQVRLRTQFAQDRIIAEVKDAMAGLQAAYDQMMLFRESVDLNLRIQEAEQRRFALGGSTVLFITLREQATADARVAAIDAVARYLIAQAEYRAALGVDALPQDTEAAR